MSGTTATSKTAQQTLEIKLAHSPDSDDAFMFYALATHKLATPGYKYTHVLSDIQTLNDAALAETYDVTAVSFAAYPTLRDKYVLLACGASFGEGYGPIVVSAKPMRSQELAGKRIAVPGLTTTAYLTLKLFDPNFEAVVMPFDKILDAVQAEAVDAGLLIHEGQLLFPQLGLHRVLDLGVWWHERTKLPLPLGGNAVRRALGPELVAIAGDLIAAAFDTPRDVIAMCINVCMTETAGVETWIAWGDEGPMCTVSVTPTGDTAGISLMATPPEHQRKGIGRALLTQVIADYRRRGVERFHLGSSQAGRRLYESLGFKLVADLPVWVLERPVPVQDQRALRDAISDVRERS